MVVNNWLRFKFFLKSHQKELNFVILFSLYFILGQIINYGFRSHISPVLIHKIHVAVSSAIINTITPAEKTYATDANLIGDGGYQLSVVTGCDGIDGILLIVAAICAFRMSVLKKLGGLFAGCLTIYSQCFWGCRYSSW